MSPVTRKEVRKVLFLSRDKAGFPDRDVLLVYPGTRHVFRWPKFWIKSVPP